MRILQVSALFEKVGGAEVYAHGLAEALGGRGHRVSFFGGSSERAIDTPEARVVRRQDWSYDALFVDRPLEAAFREHVERFRPDVIHAHNLYSFPATFPAVMASTGVRILHSPHDYSTVCSNSWCVYPDGSPCEGGPGAKCFESGCEANAPYDARNVLAANVRFHLVRRHFRSFVVMSEGLAAKLRQNGFGTIEVVPYWIDAADFGGREVVEGILRDNPREDARVVFSGRLTREKGLAYLLPAFARVVRERPEARLTLVGEGPEGEALRRQTRELGLAGVVTFTGRLERQEVLRHLARASLLALPSVWTENAPIACLESMLFRLPMVASRIGGFPDLVCDEVTGLLARPRDPDDLARQMLRILGSSELRQRLGGNCPAALARHGKREHLERIEAAYQRAAPPALDGTDTGGPDDDMLAILPRFQDTLLGVRSHAAFLKRSRRKLRARLRRIAERLRG